MADIDFFVEGRYPLIKLRLREKIASEKWRDFEYRDRIATEFDGSNYAIKCGLKQDDGYLVVLDIDPKNGGDLTLQGLIEANESLPPTITVKTGSGGYHYYFLSKEPIRKCIFDVGIDLQGEGAYVVGAGSIHPNGSLYKLIDDCELAEIPNWVVDHLGSKFEPDSTSGPFFNAHEEIEVKPEQYVQGDGCFKGGRNNAMTAEAGAMRRIGLDQDAIFQALLAINKAKCKPPLPVSELKTIAWSAAKYAPEPKPEPIKIEEINPPNESLGLISDNNELQRQYNDLFQSATGLVRDISHTMLSHAKVEIPQFALASAMGVISAHAQGSYEVSSLSMRDCPETRLSLYQWIVADSAGGKDSYKEMVNLYTRNTDDHLATNRFGSHYGMRSLLFAWNSLFAIWDEMQDEMTRLSTGGQHLVQIMTEIKELFNGPPRIAKQVIKDKVYPEVDKPRFSIIGYGTLGGFKKHLTGNIISGGYLSRFNLTLALIARHISKNQELLSVPEDQAIRLRRMVNAGLTAARGFGPSHEDLIQNFAGIDDGHGRKKSAPAHGCQTDSSRNVVNLADSAAKMLLTYQWNQRQKYIDLSNSDLADSDLSPGSILARSPQSAVKMAGLHAIGRNSLEISDFDAEWGIRYANVLASAMTKMVITEAGDTYYEKNRNKVLNSCRRFTANNMGAPRDIYRSLRFANKEIMKLLIDLSVDDEIVLIDPDIGPVSGETILTISRGFKLYKI